MPEIINEIKAFMEAQQKAEDEGEHEFTCPLCGGDAKWVRAPRNNHLHCHCGGCGFSMME